MERKPISSRMLILTSDLSTEWYKRRRKFTDENLLNATLIGIENINIHAELIASVAL